MIGTEQTVVTPCGSFVAMWDEDENVSVAYRGDHDAVEYFKAYLDLNVVSGRGGSVLAFENLEPADLYGFCQSREHGIIVLADVDDLIADSAEDDMDDSTEPALDGIGDGPVVAHADPSVLPMDQDTRTILKAAQKFALAKFGNKRVINTSDGSEILIDNNGIMHGLSAGAGVNDALVSTDLENLLRNATFMRKEDDRKGRPDILAVYRYGAMVEVQGKPLAIGVVVREHRDGRRYYDHFELKNRKVA